MERLIKIIIVFGMIGYLIGMGSFWLVLNTSVVIGLDVIANILEITLASLILFGIIVYIGFSIYMSHENYKALR